MQDLRANITRANKPKIFPLFKFDLNSASQNNKINLNTKGEFVSLRRTKGLETTKFFINQNLLYPTIFNDGTAAEVGVHLNAGFYNINKYDNPANGRFEHSKNRLNAYPVFSLKLKKPYFKSSKKYVTIIEPNVMFIKSNKKAFNRFIPDENNINNFELDYFDIFNINRLSGFDRFDPQSRVDYGIKFKKKAKKDEFVSEISVAQSYQLQRQTYMQENSGISEKFSDFVGNIALRPSDLVSFSSTFSLDQENFSLKNAYSSLIFRVNQNQLSISNIHSPVILDENGTTEIEGKNQYSISYNHKISEFWSFTSSTTFDKKDKIKYNNINSKIKYEDECVGISFSWKRQYTHNPEDPTSNSFLFLFSLKEIMEGDI